MNMALYKLGEYKIIESDTGDLRWEAHLGLGELQEGKCYKKGTILFIGPGESKSNGFLKLEFRDHLKAYTEWMKTKYFCRDLDIFHCKTGKRVSRGEMRLWMFDQKRGEGAISFYDRSADHSNDLLSLTLSDIFDFRLQKYEINLKPNGQVLWRKYEGQSGIRSGLCIILEDILFMGPGQNEQTNLFKRQFLMDLKQLPEWNQTKYYCPRFSLQECKYANRVAKGKNRWWRRNRPGEK